MFLFNYFSNYANKNARIVSRRTQNNKLRTETQYRDPGTMTAAVSTDTTGSTRLFVDMPDGKSFNLTGHEARTLKRLLDRHYAFTGKSY